MRDTYSELEAMPVQELEKLLLAELDEPCPNGAKVRRILRILESRDAQVPTQISEEVIAAWKKYRAPSRFKAWSARYLKTIVAITAVVCVIAAAAAPQVFGKGGVIELLVGWTEEIFAFSGAQEDPLIPAGYAFQTDHPGLQEIYDTVAELGVEQPVVPMWVPDEYVLKEVKTIKYSKKTSVNAELEKPDGNIKLSIDVYAAEPPNKYAKDGVIAETYNKGTREYYIFPNEDRFSAAWQVGRIQCLLIAPDRELLVDIIDSLITEVK